MSALTLLTNPSPFETGEGSSTPLGEAAGSLHTTLPNRDEPLLVSYRNNSTNLPEWFFELIAKREVIVYTAKELLAGNRPLRADEKARLYESRDVPGYYTGQPNVPLMNYIVECFLNYLENCEKKHIIIKSRKQDIKGSHAWKVVPATNRYSTTYQRKLKSRLLTLAKEHAKDSVVMLTLTVDPKIYDWDYGEMWGDFGNQINRFLTELFRELGGGRVPFLKTVEATQSGLPHAHFLFFGVRWLLHWKEVSALWKIGTVWLNGTSEGEHVDNPVKYITKYLTKTFTKTGSDNVLTQAILWYYHVRGFSHSDGLMAPMSHKRNHQWILAGNIWCSDEKIWKCIMRIPEIFDILLSDNG